MAVFREITANDIKTSRSFLSQLVDIIEEDISGSTSRRTYQVFVTGSTSSPGVTSSLFQTVYDQDFSLQTANPVFDIAVGLYYSGTTVQAIKTGEDSSGKLLFPSTSLMMREKIDIYRQQALTLLGSVNGQFAAPFGSTTSTNLISEAMFLNFKRLFFRDGIKRETFAMRFFESSSNVGVTSAGTNVNRTSENGSKIYTDVGSAVNQETTFGGKVSNIVDSSNTSRTVGVLFNDFGVAVFDLAKILSGTQKVSGVIDAVSTAALLDAPAGRTIIGTTVGGNGNARFIPDLMTSGSIDDILDHLASCRFSSGTLTAIGFQNQTIINSTILYTRATADEFNYSSNPTYVDSTNRIVVIDEGQEEIQTPFTMITSVGFYDANNNLLAVAKLSRPVEKNPEKSLLFSVRLDW